MPTVVPALSLYRLAALAACLGLAACASARPAARPAAPPAADDTLGARALYAYEPDSTFSFLTARPDPLPSGLTVRAVLDSLGRRLADGYFREHRGRSTGISFETVEVVTLPTPPDPMRVAVVDMADPDSVAMRAFFQGTTGGLISELIIRATLMQPTPEAGGEPLIDGLVLLYNGGRFPLLDHVTFQTVQSPPAGRYLRPR